MLTARPVLVRQSIHRRSHQRGLSLVELMVGITVGLFIVAAAATLVTTQLTGNRRLLLEVQVQQDLRATADIITRELRRAGSIASITNASNFVWSPGSEWSTDTTLSTVTPTTVPSGTVNYRYFRTPGGNGPYGFRLREGVIESELAEAGWQALTDPATMTVTDFVVTPQPQPAIVVACSKLCADGSKACWPRVTVRAYAIDITGQSTSDAAVVRSVRSFVRLKNDLVTTDPALGVRSCPA